MKVTSIHFDSSPLVSRRGAIGGILKYACFPFFMLKAKAQWTNAKRAGFEDAIAAASGASYLYQQDFESGVNSAPSGWAQGAGTVTWNYATAPAPLAGSFSMSPTNASRADLTLATVGAGSKTVLYYYFLYSAANKDDTLCSFIDTGGDGYDLNQNSSGANISVRVRAPGGTFASTVSTYTVNTTINIWLALSIGGAGTASIEAWFSTNATKPTTGGNNYCISSNGTTSGTFNTLQFAGASNAARTIFDFLRISTSAIGSNPT